MATLDTITICQCPVFRLIELARLSIRLTTLGTKKLHKTLNCNCVLGRETKGYKLECSNIQEVGGLVSGSDSPIFDLSLENGDSKTFTSNRKITKLVYR